MKPALRSLFTASLLISAYASAQSPVPRTLDDILVNDKGMTRISDGLYARSGESEQSFIAVNPAGQQSLLRKLLDEREKIAALRSKRNAGASATDVLDHAIATLSQPVLKSGHQNVTGDCSGPGGTGTPAIYVDVAASSGSSAGGYAGIVPGSGSSVATTNYVAASVNGYDGAGTIASNSSTTTGTTIASASANAPFGTRACFAMAEASVTCPGASSPAITGFASRWTGQPDANCL